MRPTTAHMGVSAKRPTPDIGLLTGPHTSDEMSLRRDQHRASPEDIIHSARCEKRSQMSQVAQNTAQRPLTSGYTAL